MRTSWPWLFILPPRKWVFTTRVSFRMFWKLTLCKTCIEHVHVVSNCLKPSTGSYHIHSRKFNLKVYVDERQKFFPNFMWQMKRKNWRSNFMSQYFDIMTEPRENKRKRAIAREIVLFSQVIVVWLHDSPHKTLYFRVSSSLIQLYSTLTLLLRMN